jgi:AraC-like DNA-binding protein
MAQDTHLDILQDLKKKYKKQTLSVIQTAKEIGVSSTTLRQGIKMGIGVPLFKNVGMGTMRKKIVFPIHEVAKFLSDTQQVY